MTYRDDDAAAAALRDAQQREVRGLLPDLAELRIASPCSESWDAMRGDRHVRHCARCDKDVFDLGGLTRQQIADLLYLRGADLCARFYRRADGTIMTADCVDARRLRTHRRVAVSVAAAGIATAVAVPSLAGALRTESIAEYYARQPPVDDPPPPPDDPPDDMVMGDVVAVGGMIDLTPLPPALPPPAPPPDPLVWREPDVKPASEPPRVSTTFSGVPDKMP